MSKVEDYEKKLFRFYKEAFDDLLLQITKLFNEVSKEGVWSTSETHKYRRASALYKELSKKLKDLGGLEDKNLKDLLKNNYLEQYAEELFNVNDVPKPLEPLNQLNILESMGVNVNYAQLNTDLAEEIISHKWVGGTFSSRIWDNKRKLIKNLRKTLNISMSSGEGIPQITSRLQKTMNSGYYDTVRLARTEVIRVRNKAKINVYKDNEIDKVEWDSSPEQDRTCDICASRNGERYEINKVPHMPAHPNCRCTWIPVVPE